MAAEACDGGHADDIPPGRLLSLGPRPAAVARGRERLRAGPVPAAVLAAAIFEAHALLRDRVLDSTVSGRAGLWLQVDASRRRNDPRKATLGR